MSESTRRLEFHAPDRLVERADALAAALDTDRPAVLRTALREYLDDVARNDDLEQAIAAAYYDDKITFEQVSELVGREAAANFRVLKQQLDDSYIDGIAEL